jgi:hypothetical protein
MTVDTPRLYDGTSRLRIADGESSRTAHTPSHLSAIGTRMLSHRCAQHKTEVTHPTSIDALYTEAPQLPADYETAGTAKLRREAHARMVGNGLCTRPVELDCRLESA